MDEMLTRVAEAIYEKQRRHATMAGDHQPAWRDLSDMAKGWWSDDAAQVLEAMREPSEAMCRRVIIGRIHDAPCAVWRAMIDEALK